MASENLTMELWEIIQKNNQEEISYNDFENDLNKSFNLPKDEADRAIALMISQAEVNPNLIGEYKGGIFIISKSFAATITSTIKYENQFIPGKEEYNVRMSMESLKNDIVPSTFLLSPQLIDSMIENYRGLSDKEIDQLWSNYSKLSSNNKSKLIQAHNDKLREVLEDPNVSKEEKDAVSAEIDNNNKRDAMRVGAEGGDPLAEKNLRDRVKRIKEADPQLFGTLFPGYDNIDQLPMDIIKTICEVDDQYKYMKQRNDYYRLNESEIKRGPQDRQGRSYGKAIDNHMLDTLLKESMGFEKDSDWDEKFELLIIAANSKNNVNDLKILNEPEDYVYYLGMLNETISKSGGMKNVSYAKFFVDALKNIPPETALQDITFFGDYLRKTAIEMGIISEMGDVIEKFMASKGAALIFEGFKEDREGVTELVLNPYLNGIREGKTLEVIVQENFPDVDSKKKSDIIDRYKFRATTINNPILNNNSAKGGVITREQLPHIINHRGRPITEEELESGIKGQEEHLVVDRTGYLKAIKEISINKSSKHIQDIEQESVDETDERNSVIESSTQIDVVDGFSHKLNPEAEIDIFGDYFGGSSFVEGRNTTGVETRREALEENESEEKSEDVKQQSDSTRTNSKKIIKTPLRTASDLAYKLSQKAKLPRKRMQLFNPESKKQLNRIFGTIRTAFVMTEIEMMREAVRLAEEKTGVKLDVNLADEVRDE